MSDLMWCVVGIVGSSVVSYIISWLFSTRYNLVADIVTVPSRISKYSERVKLKKYKKYELYDTYVILKNNGNKSLRMSDFAPMNMPRIMIMDGKFQKRQKPYYVLPNPNPFAMYNNVCLNDEDGQTVYITFDQLKAGHTIEVVVHSLIDRNYHGRVKLAVAATLVDGKFIPRKSLRAMHAMIQIIVSAIAFLIFLALPTVSDMIKNLMMVIMIMWWLMSAKIVDLISYHGIRKKIVIKK